MMCWPTDNIPSIIMNREHLSVKLQKYNRKYEVEEKNLNLETQISNQT